jgi:hypothetical protein
MMCLHRLRVRVFNVAVNAVNLISAANAEASGCPDRRLVRRAATVIEAQAIGPRRPGVAMRLDFQDVFAAQAGW